VSGPRYSDLIQTGAKTLRQAGLSEPVREARRLVELASSLSATELIAREPQIAASEHARAFQSLLERRAKREPFAHLKGQTAFYGLDLISDARALIPRPDSEIVVDLALERIPSEADWQIADLGTGTGALLAAILANRPQTTGVGVEASAEAHALVSENMDRLGLSDRSELFLGTWSEWTEWSHCDLIISNPPYIESKVIAGLEPEVRDFDPAKALDGGADGLDAYREIISLAAQRMKSASHLVLEIGFDQKRSVSSLLEAAGFTALAHVQDLGGNDRAIAATKT